VGVKRFPKRNVYLRPYPNYQAVQLLSIKLKEKLPTFLHVIYQFVPGPGLFISSQCFENRLRAKLHCLDRNAFVGGVDGLREIEAFRQHHRQEAIGLNAQA
jgi:hypothetical protein